MRRPMLFPAMPFFPTVARELTQAENRLRRFFEGELDTFPIPETLGWVPAVEIVEKPEELILRAELPGMKEENVEVTFENELLTIRGEKKEEQAEEKKEEEGVRFHLWERTYGAFTRTFALPRTIDATKIVAEMKNGLLTIHLPKTAVAKKEVRKIAVTPK
jgi:HSP20 family protein